MTKKLDFLGECNTQKIPLEDFRLAFCVRCFQADCTRSQFGTSKFEARVNNWEERLFKAPQLAKTDPRFPLISAKRFLSLNSGPAPSIREWIDPQNLDVSPPAVQVSPVLVVTPPAQGLLGKPRQEPPPEPQKEPEKEQPQPNSLVISVSREPEPEGLLGKPRLNTPYAGPMTLASSPENTPVVKDAWAAPAPLKPGERVVKPGAKVKFGGRP
jgi:hypothetical protein